MKRKLKAILSIFLCIAVLGLSGVLSACFFMENIYDVDDGFDDADDYVAPEYDFYVSVTNGAEAKTTITINGVGAYGEIANVVFLKNYQYLYGEPNHGIAEETAATPQKIDDYICGSEAIFEIARYQDDYDTLYAKFYVIDDGGNILAGPVFPTDIEPIFTHPQNIVAKGIKGIMCDDAYREQVAELGCEHTELNFLFSGMIVPNEMVNVKTGEITPMEYTESISDDGDLVITGPNGDSCAVEKYYYNGQRYYFRLDDYANLRNLRYYDDIIARYSNDGVKVTLIILMNYSPSQYIQPYLLTYPASHTQESNTLRAVNTSNAYGANYFGAFMEFIGRRYSQEDGSTPYKYGTVESYVMGNEIDASYFWNAIVDIKVHEALSLEDYMTEYERMLRISNQALKKYYANCEVLVSVTNRWTVAEGPGYYPPKEIFDFLSEKSLKEGNYNWGIAAHPYGVSLSNPGFWQGDKNSPKMTGSLTTSNITWSNLELLQLYLEQPTKLCNGEVRSVYITEGGVSSSDAKNIGMFTEPQYQQAAGVAYLYYKCVQLSCIKAVNYYRLIDNTGESAYFGLFTADMTGKKPAYNVYRYIDTQYSYDVSSPYLDYITWSEFQGGGFVAYGTKYGNVNSYFDVMPLYSTRFDWSEHWDESKIQVRIVDEVPDFI